MVCLRSPASGQGLTYLKVSWGWTLDTPIMCASPSIIWGLWKLAWRGGSSRIDKNSQKELAAQQPWNSGYKNMARVYFLDLCESYSGHVGSTLASSGSFSRNK